MERPRILHIVEAYGGGVFAYVRDLTVWQSEKYDVYVMFNGLCENMPADHQKQFPQNVTLINSPEINRSMRPEHIARAVFAIKKAVKEVRPDIVHLHSAFSGLYGRLALNGKGMTVLYSPHAYSFLSSDSPGLKKKFFFFAEKLLGTRNCITLCVCKSEYDESLAVTKRQACINSGIDVDAFQRLVDDVKKGMRCRDKGARKTRVIMTGRICEQKRPGLFNEIAAKLPELDFIWIGDGPLIGELNCGNVTVAGWMERQSVIEQLLRADIFLFPTEFETISIALLEAMYLELPCVVSNVSGNRDVIKNGVTGYLCDDVNGYVQAIRSIMASPTDVKAMTAAAKASVLDEFSAKRIRERYEELFDTIIDR